jgi:hypothetical protein
MQCLRFFLGDSWTAPTEIEFRCRTMIGVSAYLKIDNKKKKLNFFFHGKKKFSTDTKKCHFFCFKTSSGCISFVSTAVPKTFLIVIYSYQTGYLGGPKNLTFFSCSWP